jgi:hypothetical protein
MYAWQTGQAARRARVKERLQPATRLRHNGGSEALSRRQEAHRKALVRRAHVAYIGQSRSCLNAGQH